MKLSSQPFKITFVWPAILFCCIWVSCRNRVPEQGGAGYRTIEVTLGNKTLSSQYSAAIKGKQAVEIRPQVSGVITEICIDEGATVKKGETLFVIDQVPYKAALETALANVKSAQARVATAKLTAESKQELYRQEVVSEFDLQTARNSLLEAEAALAQAHAAEIQARNDLSYTLIKSPLTGVAGMIPYKVGTLVSSSVSTPLITVSDDDEVYAYFSLTENQILSLTRRNGTSSGIIRSMPGVELLLSDGSAYGHKGRIDAVSGTVDTRTGAVSVRATFPNPGKILRNGGSATVVIPYDKTDCIIIPQSATFDIQDRTYVYKVVGNKTCSVEITTFPVHNGTEYIVESGLQPGDIIISEGAGLLRDGVEIDMNLQNQQKQTKQTGL